MYCHYLCTIYSRLFLSWYHFSRSGHKSLELWYFCQYPDSGAFRHISLQGSPEVQISRSVFRIYFLKTKNDTKEIWLSYPFYFIFCKMYGKILVFYRIFLMTITVTVWNVELLQTNFPINIRFHQFRFLVTIHCNCWFRKLKECYE